MPTGSFICRRGRDMLLLSGVVGLSDHEKFLQREADDGYAHTTQVDSDVMMNHGVAVARHLRSND